MNEHEYQRIALAVGAVRTQIPWRRRTLHRLAKRMMDIIVSITMLVFCWPILLLTALAVKLTSRGPALFIQVRVGEGGVPFRMLKFRSMTVAGPGGHEIGEVTAQDARLTSIGQFLRASRLDELPQLVHVLLGEMSLVGPRPDIPENLHRYNDDQLIRFAMPQGCTTWGVIRGGLMNSWSERQDINAEYVWNWNFWLDLKIIFQTAVVLLAQKNTTAEKAEN